MIFRRRKTRIEIEQTTLRTTAASFQDGTPPVILPSPAVAGVRGLHAELLTFGDLSTTHDRAATSTGSGDKEAL